MTTETRKRPEQRDPSFWAFVLIGAGLIWLLAEANILTGANLAVLFRLWPLILIAFGLELLFGRDSTRVTVLIGLGTVGVMVVLMIIGPALGLAGSVEIREMQFSEPVGEATSANIEIDLSVGTATIAALEDSPDLINADIRYAGDALVFTVDERDNRKVVQLGTEGSVNLGFEFFGMSFSAGDEDLLWDIGLTPRIPLAVAIAGGVGNTTVDLSGLRLTQVDIATGVGEIDLRLPAADDRYAVEIDGGVGRTHIAVADDAAIDLRINGGVGETVLDLPDAAPIRLDVDSGISSVEVANWLERVSGEGGSFNSDGVWETASYASASAAERIDIQFDGGVGSLTVR
ncbi:MAG: hypothetical protein GYB67_05180 [Chloroflexi bacterium]|nr:hypothetical protein [Chloroflexota bacterium]